MITASTVASLDAPPSDITLDEEGLAAYRARFHEHYQRWGALLQENLDRLARGSYSLAWMDTSQANWGVRVKPSSRGLTYTDIARPPAYGTIPEVATYRNMAPRGSVRDPYADRFPIIEAYDVLAKRDVWADNVYTLYEEAKARQWNSTSDIPWTELEPAREDLEKAACQFATFLTEVEFVAGDFPARWIYRIAPDYFEVKNFLVTQMMDEARHLEVFRKRALAGGGGLLHASPAFEWSLKAILEAPTHTMGTFLLNVLGEGLVLTIFRAGEFLSKTQVDKEIFRRCMQDEARHVSYGTLQLKEYLTDHPDRERALADMHGFADIGEQIILTSLTDPAVLEPLAILMGDGLDRIDEGMEGVSFLWSTIVGEYLDRCERAGFARRERCTIPQEFPFATQGAYR